MKNVDGLTEARVAELAERHWVEWTERGWCASPGWEDLHPIDRMQLVDAMRATMAHFLNDSRKDTP